MEAHICDRCGAVVNSSFNHGILKHSANTVKDKHLCMKCYTRALSKDKE